MTLDEAIKHCLEVVKKQEYLSKSYHEYREEKRNVRKRAKCAECAADHRQLAEWLTELKERRSKGWISCEEQLPEENVLVLCYARSTTGEGNNYFLGALAHGEFWFLKVNDIGHLSCPVLHWEVTHWMPLPEPPRNGGADDENS